MPILEQALFGSVVCKHVNPQDDHHIECKPKPFYTAPSHKQEGRNTHPSRVAPPNTIHHLQHISGQPLGAETLKRPNQQRMSLVMRKTVTDTEVVHSRDQHQCLAGSVQYPDVLLPYRLFAKATAMTI